MKSNSRREFIRNALGLVVVTGATPHMVLGRLLPSLSDNAGGQLVATYVIKLSEYPVLQIPGGSVKLTSPEQLKLNPEHVEYGDIGLRFSDARRGWYPIAVTRVLSEDMPDAFCAVSTYCRHGKEYQVNYKSDQPGEVGYFECPHEKSRYSACGIWQAGNGPDLSALPDPNLLRFTTTFDGDNVILNGVLSSVDGLDPVPPETFLDQPRPTPADSFAVIRFGLAAAAEIRLSMFAPDGRLVRTLAEGRREPGIHYADLVVKGLPAGAYHIRLSVDATQFTKTVHIVR